jgi:Chloriridovirus helicase
MTTSKVNKKFINTAIGVKLMPNEGVKLNKQQMKALDIMLAGNNIFITAPAGTGKTFLINHFCAKVREEDPDRNIAITSTTGVSAILIGGTTLHSYLGIGFGDGTVKELVDKILFTARGIKAAVWRKLKTLVIDEASMLDPILFDKLENIARIVRGNSLPFGGIQLIISADLLQLPVVKSGGGGGTKDGDEKTEMEFVTDAKSWRACMKDNIILLTEIIRQKDSLFKEILLKIRVGNIDDQVKTILTAHMKKCEDQASDLEHNTSIQPTRLFCLKKYVQDFNDIELQKLKDAGKLFSNFNALVQQYSCEAVTTTKGRSRCSDAQFKFLSDRFVKDCTTPRHLRVCEDAQVMLTYNVNQEAGLVNGSRGVIIGFSETKFPIVKFKNHTDQNSDGLEMEVRPQTWEITNDFGQKVGYFKQIPLKIAYALTVHSCQGSTLDSAEVDLSDTFEHGQVYTALSRTRDLNSLVIKNLCFKSIKCHPRALKFYKDLRERQDLLSEVENDLSELNFDDDF